MVYIGIDIGKSTFIAAYPQRTGYKTRSFQNTVKGIHQFIGTLNIAQDHCVMEATGNYSFMLLYMLVQQQYSASLVNPKQIKHFSRMMMSVTKTDKQGACLIAQYGEKMNPPKYRIPSDSLIILKQKRAVLRQLRKQRTSSGNLKDSLSVLPTVDKCCLNIINKTIKFLDEQIERIEKDLIEVAMSDFESQMKALTSIKGIGTAIATSLIIVTGGFHYFDNSKQVARYLGICPTYQQSGTSLNVHGSINRNGDSALRSTLYIATWSAIRSNTACKECYDRLRNRGKPAKVALFAVANNLYVRHSPWLKTSLLILIIINQNRLWSHKTNYKG